LLRSPRHSIRGFFNDRNSFTKETQHPVARVDKRDHICGSWIRSDTPEDDLWVVDEHDES
jgi:hypothetical protein